MAPKGPKSVHVEGSHKGARKASNGDEAATSSTENLDTKGTRKARRKLKLKQRERPTMPISRGATPTEPINQLDNENDSSDNRTGKKKRPKGRKKVALSRRDSDEVEAQLPETSKESQIRSEVFRLEFKIAKLQAQHAEQAHKLAEENALARLKKEQRKKDRKERREREAEEKREREIEEQREAQKREQREMKREERRKREMAEQRKRKKEEQNRKEKKAKREKPERTYKEQLGEERESLEETKKKTKATRKRDRQKLRINARRESELELEKKSVEQRQLPVLSGPAVERQNQSPGASSTSVKGNTQKLPIAPSPLPLKKRAATEPLQGTLKRRAAVEESFTLRQGNQGHRGGRAHQIDQARQSKTSNKPSSQPNAKSKAQPFIDERPPLLPQALSQPRIVIPKGPRNQPRPNVKPKQPDRLQQALDREAQEEQQRPPPYYRPELRGNLLTPFRNTRSTGQLQLQSHGQNGRRQPLGISRREVDFPKPLPICNCDALPRYFTWCMEPSVNDFTGPAAIFWASVTQVARCKGHNQIQISYCKGLLEARRANQLMFERRQPPNELPPRPANSIPSSSSNETITPRNFYGPAIPTAQPAIQDQAQRRHQSPLHAQHLSPPYSQAKPNDNSFQRQRQLQLQRRADPNYTLFLTPEPREPSHGYRGPTKSAPGDRIGERKGKAVVHEESKGESESIPKPGANPRLKRASAKIKAESESPERMNRYLSPSDIMYRQPSVAIKIEPESPEKPGRPDYHSEDSDSDSEYRYESASESDSEAPSSRSSLPVKGEPGTKTERQIAVLDRLLASRKDSSSSSSPSPSPSLSSSNAPKSSGKLKRIKNTREPGQASSSGAGDLGAAVWDIVNSALEPETTSQTDSIWKARSDKWEGGG
ncbi:MAG: hypothetical protein M1819_003653 [Sarea resinae]|nr:MAG: hypothetical protein M1819_003653 [Sarea resinae]